MTKPIEELLIERFGAEKVAEMRKIAGKRKLNVIVVEDKIAVLRPVGAAEVANYSMMVATDNDLEKASRYLLEELWIEGDNEVRDDEESFISAMMQLQRVMEVKKSSFFQL